MILIPNSHRDLLDQPLPAVLATLLADGAPHSSVVWCEQRANEVLINTTLERQKGRNLARDPRATVLVMDPADGGRFIEIRGTATLTTTGAVDHLDELTRANTMHPHYYGYIYPESQKDRETRVIVRITPKRIVTDAIHR